jgi:hypothetical protein
MGLILYKALLFKEIIYGLLFKGMAALIVYIEAGHIPKNWIYLAAIVIFLFPASTYILNIFRKHWPDSPGWAFMALSMLKMILLPILIFLFLDKNHADIESFVIPLLVAYLILMAIDTKWKIKWLFYPR